MALQQDEVSLELFHQARAGRVRLFLPTFCLAEATKNVEARQSELRRVLKDQIPRLSRELARSPATRQACAPLDQSMAALASAHDAMTAEFWPVLAAIVATVTPLQMTTSLGIASRNTWAPKALNFSRAHTRS